MTPLANRTLTERWAPSRWAVCFGLLAALAMALAAGLAYHHQSAVLREAAERQLAVVADLKRDQVVGWLAAQRTFASAVSDGALLALEIESWRREGGSPVAWRERWTFRLQANQRVSGAEDVTLLDLDGAPIASSDPAWDATQEPPPGVLAQVAASGGAVVSTIHHHEGERRWLDIFSPVIAADAAGRRVVAFLAIRFDPDRGLFPIVRAWPFPSGTAQVLLAERRGDHLVYLHALRGRDGAALDRRVPLSERELLVTRAVGGARGLLEGKDDRGEEVLGVAVDVPGTSWILLAKQDRAEAYAALWPRTLASAGGMLLFFLGAVLVVSSWLRQRAAALAERHVRESRRMIEAFFESAGFGISVVDHEGRFVEVNSGLARFLGYTPAELRALTVDDVTDAEDLGATHEHRARVLEGRAPSYTQEKRYVRKDGQVVWGLLAVTAVRRANGRVESTIGIVADITERKRIESELAVAVERLSLATRGAGIGIWDWDVQRNVLVWDDNMYRLCGLRREDFGDPRQAFARAVTRADVERSEAEVREALRGQGVYATEYDVRWPDGSVRHVQASARALRDRVGRAHRVLGIAIDITDLRRSHRQLEALNREMQERTRQAEAASRAKSEFLANVSHEIRTPMNAIVGLGRLLARSELAPRQQDYVDRIRAASRDLLGIINDVLDLSKIEADRLEVERVPFEVAEVLAHVAGLTGERAREKGLALRCRLSPDVPARLMGDPLRLGQVLLNLVSNAVKFTQRGWVSVEVGADQAPAVDGGGARLRFVVRDTGIGIPAEALPRIFQAFTQADSSTTRRFGGTGLGLTISRRLVQLMGGELAVESAPGGGSTFSFVLPLEAAAAAPGEAPLAANAGHLAERGDLRGRVLVADDNETNRLVVRACLEASGIELEEAVNGREAVEKALRAGDPFELVLMDIQMPELDGLEATARIHAARPGLAVVAMTAHVMASDRARCLEAGMKDHLAKPLDEGELWRVLERWLPSPRAPGGGGEPGRAPPGLAGDASPRERFQAALRRDLADAAERLREAVRQGDAALAGRAAHALKGLALPDAQLAIREAARVLHRAIQANEPWRGLASELEEAVRSSTSAAATSAA